MSKLGLNRQVLANITNNNQEAIKALEQVFNDVSVVPEQIQSALSQAAQALASVNSIMAQFAEVVGNVEALLAVAAREQRPEVDEFAVLPAQQVTPQEISYVPVSQYGSIALQNVEAVEITGGTIGLDAGTVAAPSFYLGSDTTTGLYRIGLNNWGLSIAGTKLMDFAGALVSIAAPLSTTGNLTITKAAGVPKITVIANAGTNETYLQFINTGGGYYFGVENSASGWFGATAYAAVVVAPVGKVIEQIVGGTISTTTSGTGFKVAGGFGCNTKGEQGPYASGGALAGYAAGGNGLDTGANMSALHAMVVSIRAALVANGIMS